MSNPLFNEQRMEADRAGWAAPVAADAAMNQAGTPVTNAPISDGPISSWERRPMTLNGTISATSVLFIILLISAAFGWSAADGPTLENGQETYQFPALGIAGIIVGFVAVIAASFKPMLAKWLGPVYALGYGFAVGAISKGYETFQDGIVVQAVMATIAVVFSMLVLYRTRIIKVTERFRKVVIGATMGIMLMYLVSFVISLFGGDLAFINSPSLLGIGFSIVVCALAAFNLALDFDLIERGVKERMPKQYEWVAALGLVVTIVWLYLELLRLLSKLQQR